MILGIISGCSTQPPPDPMVLVNVESAFAAAVADKGMRDAFLEYSANEAVMFVPGVVRVKEHYGASQRRPGLLTWQPTYAEIASSGDLGWTTGPWEWRQNPSNSAPQATGHYITIWKRQPDSTWKFVLDIGVANNAPVSEPSAPVLRVLDPPIQRQRVEPGRGREDLLEAEYGFRGASVSEGLVAAYLSRMTEDVRFYRMGLRPVQGSESVSAALSQARGTCTWDVHHAEVSQNSDLGYTFGTSALSDTENTVSFSFMRVWHRNIEGIWKLALDIQIPLPSPEETP
jgi:ketosteroid isomerase-like protein